MKTWQAMYAVIWVAFVQILFILFSPFGDTVNLGVHISNLWLRVT
ncbi:MAG TPA: hypothetical protein VEC08_05940 [Nitrososphaerales archaeon]|nr:hypothetical protein [Nitrososphaerales archaeon]